MDAPTTIALLISLLALAGLVFLLYERYRTESLKSRFGPEYDRAVDQEGSAWRAKAVLGERQKRVASYQIRPLTRGERDRYVTEWKNIQAHFVDDPRNAIAEADRLVGEAMGARGYPASDFERQAADLSVDHPNVLDDYRVAHDLTIRCERGQATTEDLRIAMQHYRNLFEEIADAGLARVEVHR